MGRLPVDSDVQAAILHLLKKGVQKWEHSIFLYLQSELNGGSHPVEVIQESFCLALPQNASGVVNIPLPEAGLHWGSVEGKLFEELDPCRG